MRDNTRKEIELAIKRIQTGQVRKVDSKRRLTILSVAEEAGVSDSLIHNRYPELAHRIRAFEETTWRKKPADSRRILKTTRNELRDTKAALKQLQIEYSRMADINKLLTLENDKLRRASARGRNISPEGSFDVQINSAGSANNL